jgi:N-acetylmuramoyl-L-alanine amidase
LYGVATEAAVRAFQEAHGLRSDGVCDDSTWSRLVEASWELGDRHLYFRSPNQRGDDVADLQARLGRLGFDAGRVDGIFGPDTDTALREFQRNVGIMPDGICGYETLRALDRIASRTDSGRSVTSVKEDEKLRQATRGLDGKRVVVGQNGELGALARSVSRSLRLAGGCVLEVNDPEAVPHAQAANRYEAGLYLGLSTGTDESYVAYYQVPAFESVGGRRMAERLHHHLLGVGYPLNTPRGMRMPVLRETRMPAVVLELGPVAPSALLTPRIAQAVVAAVRAWLTVPVIE